MSITCISVWCSMFGPPLSGRSLGISPKLSWRQFISPVEVSQYPSFPGTFGAWCELHELLWEGQLIHYCIDAEAVGPCCAPSDQTFAVCAQMPRCQEIRHCWTSLSHLQPVPMESSLWQSGHKAQVTQISQAVTGLPSKGQLGEHKCLCCAVPMDWAQHNVCVHVRSC